MKFLSNKAFHISVGTISGIVAVAIQVVPQLHLPPAEDALVNAILFAINTYLHSK